MARTLPVPPPGFDDLSIEERLDYVQSLWDHISADASQVEVPDWHRALLAERLAAHRADPEAARPWDEVREDLLQKIRSRPTRT
jgi:putative addiction module component (TIGR02574 family)